MKITIFQITPTERVQVPARGSTLDEMSRALPGGFYTTFTTLFHGTKVFKLKLHLQRLYLPAKAQGIIPAVDEQILRKNIEELAGFNLPNESRIRLILTKNSGNLYAATQPFEPLAKSIYQKGVRVISSKLTRQRPRVKDTGFIFSSGEERKQIGAGIFEILLQKNGEILEGMTSNFYAVKKDTLLTARNGILLGVTRRAILQLARREGMSIDYRAPKITEKFDEAFLTSSSRGVVPIVSIDNHKVGQGSAGKWTKLLSKHYQTYLEKHAETITE